MPLKKLSSIDWVVVLLFSSLLILSIFFFRQARHWIDKDFPGFLTFENKIVGAFNQSEWEGTKEGLQYHDYIQKTKTPTHYKVVRKHSSRVVELPTQIFSLEDFFKVFCLPFFSGLIFLLLGLLIYWLMRPTAGAFPFLLFNFGVAYYLMASFDFHSSYHFSKFFLLNFSLLPAHMTAFALIYPASHPLIKKWRWFLLIPYLISLLLFIPYQYSFYHNPLSWPTWEKVVVIYAAFSYFFWIIRLGQIIQSPQYEGHRVVARSLLIGQLAAFIVPLLVAIYVYLLGGNIPFNWIAPANIVFPVAALFGMTLGNLRQTQMELVQREKMASLGQLLAGVAHEINNPITFIYSNLPPLKEYLHYLKRIVPSTAPQYRGEMTAQEVVEDLESLVKDMEEGAQRTQQIIGDLRRFGHSQEETVTSVSLFKGLQGTINLLKNEWFGRIQIHLDCPQDLTLQANPGQIAQVWMNLLSNAIQAIKGTGSIWVQAKKEKDKIVVSIKDTGCGMPSSLVHKIFDPFFTTKEPGKGTGLGLSIVQQIVKKWGGEIQVRSEAGKGTEFQLIF